jgi:hypothetical protein
MAKGWDEPLRPGADARSMKSDAMRCVVRRPKLVMDARGDELEIKKGRQRALWAQLFLLLLGHNLVFLIQPCSEVLSRDSQHASLL